MWIGVLRGASTCSEKSRFDFQIGQLLFSANGQSLMLQSIISTNISHYVLHCLTHFQQNASTSSKRKKYQLWSCADWTDSYLIHVHSQQQLKFVFKKERDTIHFTTMTKTIEMLYEYMRGKIQYITCCFFIDFVFCSSNSFFSLVIAKMKYIYINGYNIELEGVIFHLLLVAQIKSEQLFKGLTLVPPVEVLQLFSSGLGMNFDSWRPWLYKHGFDFSKC